MINRDLQKQIFESLTGSQKAVLLLGPRQVGKTTLVRQIACNLGGGQLWFTGDNPDDVTLLTDMTLSRWRPIVGNNKYIFIDEAQKIDNIGRTAKLITDYFDDVHIILTGSSSFQLKNAADESLTGRKKEFLLLPLSYNELTEHYGTLAERRDFNSRLIFGSYPAVITESNDKAEVLESLSESYLYKDILAVDGVRKTSMLMKLTRALALQMGSEVVLNELSRTVGLNKETIARYIALLEQAFIIFMLPSYSSNQRTEIRHGKKVYFYDNGIRNSILHSYKSFDLRDGREQGMLFENYLVSERMKFLKQNRVHCNSYFWRTTTQAEVDYLEESDMMLYAWEFKHNVHTKYKISKTFTNVYPAAVCQVITPDNIQHFLSKND